jgi:hypothetical protein
VVVSEFFRAEIVQWNHTIIFEVREYQLFIVAIHRRLCRNCVSGARASSTALS